MTTVLIRFARANDVGVLLQLIRELAAYERAPDAVVATEDEEPAVAGFDRGRRDDGVDAGRRSAPDKDCERLGAHSVVNPSIFA